MNFDQAFEILLKHEGGWVNDQRDPGGETKFGISKTAYPNIDIKNLTLDAAKIIYRSDYWDECNLDKLPSWCRYMVFDCAVNQGVSFAKLALMTSITEPFFDQDPYDFFKRYATLRLHRYIKNKNWNIYGKGWAVRLLEVSIESCNFRMN